ncbi:MAG: phosphatase PAP2 family protein [bacterium]|nr:phosphatase PAP2 family protein [bacterium]
METIYAVQSIAAPWLDVLMTWVTDLGSQEAYVALMVVTYLAIDARAGRTIGVALMLSFMLNQYAKGAFDTPRPFTLDPSVARTERAVAGALGPGFPSGHAQSSVTFWILAAVLARRAWFTGAAILIVAAVAFSRVYLGVHVPLDVVGGLALGALVVAAAVAVVRSEPTWPTWAVIVLGTAGPFALHLLAPTPESDLLMGALAALVVGPMLVPHRTDGPLWGRALVALIGLVLAFTVLVASSELLPESIKRDPVGGFVRYFVLGASATLVAPWIGRAFGLVPVSQRRRT